MEMADKSRRTVVVVLFLLLSLLLPVVSSLILPPVAVGARGDGSVGGGGGGRGRGRSRRESAVAKEEEGEGEKRHQQGPNAAERAMGVAAPRSAWDTVRSWGQIALMNPRPTDSGLARSKSGGAGKLMREAAARSFETSKATVEQAAKSAVRAAGEAVHKTKEKVKRTLSSSHHRKPGGGGGGANPDADL